VDDVTSEITETDCMVGDNVPDIWMMHFCQVQSYAYIYTALQQLYAAAPHLIYEDYDILVCVPV
jgi:hypothetical protein